MSWLEKALPVAINRRLINKNENNDQLAFVEGWENLNLTVEELAGAVAHGYAFCAQMSGGRKKSNFQACGFAAVDIDGSMRLDEVEEVDIIRTSATLIYTTTSHSEAEHRFRVVFALERAVTDADEYRALLRTLALQIGGDKAATDPARIFYGNRATEFAIENQGLTNEQIENLIDQSFNFSEQRSEGAPADRRTSVSLTKLQVGHRVMQRDGSWCAYNILEVRTPVCCPFHYDTRPSAFIIESQRRVKGIHCSACASSYWPEHDDDFDFRSFEKAARSIKIRLEDSSADEDKLIYDILSYVDQPGSIAIANEQYVESLSVEPGLIFVKSPKGSGKTQFLKTIANLKGKSILLIGHRRSLIGQMCDTLEIDCYLDDDKGVKSDKKRYGISLDSVCSVPYRSKYDYVLIDESEQVLSHFLSDTLREKRTRVFQHLKQLIKSARHVIALDADCGWLTFMSLCQWACEDKQKREISIYINEHRPTMPPVQLFHDRNTIVGDIKNALKEKQKIYVTSNSKKAINKIHADVNREFNKKFLVVTSDTTNSAEVINFIKNPAERARVYDAIFASPSISSGVDISYNENEEVFDAVYGIFESEITDHHECDQQIARVRHPKNVKVFISPRRFFYDTAIETIMNDVVMSNVMEHLLKGYDDNSQPIFDREDQLLQLVSLVMAQRRASMNNLKQNYIAYKRQQGCEIIEVENDVNLSSVGRRALIRGRKLSEEQYIERLMSAKKLSRREFHEIEKRYELGRILKDDEMASYQRSRLEIFYGTKISPTLVKLDDGGRYQECVVRYEILIDKNAANIIRSLGFDKELRKNSSVNYRTRGSQVEFIRDILELIGMLRDGRIDPSCVVDRSMNVELVKFLRENARRYEIAFGEHLREDFRKKPFRQLGILLKKVGLKQKSRKTSRKGESVYQYQVEENGYEQLHAIYERRNSDAQASGE